MIKNMQKKPKLAIVEQYMMLEKKLLLLKE